MFELILHFFGLCPESTTHITIYYLYINFYIYLYSYYSVVVSFSKSLLITWGRKFLLSNNKPGNSFKDELC